MLEAHAHELAAVLVEPVQSRNPDLQPAAFLHELRSLTREHGVPMVFDEVITGLRTHARGAQGYFGVQADLGVYGKVLGGGLPMAAVAGQARFFDALDGGHWSFFDASTPGPASTFVAGTFNKHPLSLAGASAVLEYLTHAGPLLQEQLNARTTALANRLNELFVAAEVPIKVSHFGSMFRFAWLENASYVHQPLEMDFFYANLNLRGVYVWEGRTCFLSTAHTDEDLDRVVQAAAAAIGELTVAGFFGDARKANERSDLIGAHGAPSKAATYPLSTAQKQLSVLSLIDDRGSAAYQFSACLRLTGDYRHDVMTRALCEVQRRHDALRTVVDAGGDVQHVRPEASLDLPLVERAPSGAPWDDEQIDQWLIAQGGEAFDLSAGPALRAHVLRLSPAEHLLVLRVHHILVDGWSMGVILNEIAAAYSAEREGRLLALSAPMQFRQYLDWQAGLAGGPAFAAHEDFWRRRLAGAPTGHNLPTDNIRSARRTYLGSKVSRRIEPALTSRLRHRASEQGCTLFMVLLSAYFLLLNRLSRQEDMVVCAPALGRGLPGAEGMVGYSAHFLPLRSHYDPETPLAGFLNAVRTHVLESFEHEDFPFAELIERMRADSSSSIEALMSVNFNFDRPIAQPKFAGLGVSLQPDLIVFTPFDLAFDVTDLDETLSVDCTYDTTLFERATAERFLRLYHALLDSIAEADAGLAVGKLPWLEAAELHKILVEWNATDADYPRDKCVHELFEAQVERTPDAVAVVHGDRELSYGELNARANRLAHHLRTLGVGPDDRVAICVERGLDMVVGLLGVLKAGGAYVPLDPSYPTERLAFILSDSAPIVVLTDTDSRAVLTGCRLDLPVIDLLTDAERWAHQPGSNPNRAGLTSSHLTYVIYTSGSTGQPKGVMLPHEALRHYTQGAVALFGLQPDDRVMQQNSINFDLSVEEIMPALAAGAALHIQREVLHAAGDPCTASVVHLTAAHWHRLVAQKDHDVQRLLASVRLINVTGDALSAQMLQRWLQIKPARTRLVNTYGPTETAVSCTAAYLGEPAPHGVVTIGRPLQGARIYILDARGEPVPVGVPGELYIGGAGVARGYLNRPELTAERFLANPFAAKPGARMYKTGDLGRWLPDGTIEFLGRNDFQVKVRGFRIELGEIEARLLEHPDVRQAVVLAREDQPGDRRLVAYYVGEEDVGAEALRAHLAKALPDYTVPAAYVHLEHLPLTPNGKLDRKVLPAPEAGAYAARAYEPPRGEIEETLARIWAELLGVDRVGRNAHFFELGGHSLLAVGLIERMRQAGLAADVRTLYARPTLSELAEAARDGGASASSAAPVPPNRIASGCTHITADLLPLVSLTQQQIDAVVATVPGGAANIQDIYPLAPLQEGILFHHLMQGQGDAYLMRVQLTFAHRERLDGFLAALQAVIDRHDVLRTAVVWESLPEPVQVVWREARLNVQTVEIDPAMGDVAAQLAKRFDPSHVRIDVREAPLLNGYIAHDAAGDRWLLQMLCHHLIQDDISLGLLIEEVYTHLQGRADQLPPPSPFRDFVVRARLGTPREEHEAFFREMLGDVDEPTAPFGLLDAAPDESNVQETTLQLPASLGQALGSLARAFGVSTACLFHLAWARVLGVCAGRDDVVFGTVLLGRMSGGADCTLGMFINTLPVRVRLDDRPLRQAARELHDMLAQLLRHEHAPLVLAQRCSGVPSPAPLFTALLNYRYNRVSSPDLSDDAFGVITLYDQERSNYPLDLSVDNLGDDNYALTLQVRGDIQPHRVVECMLHALRMLTQSLERTIQLTLRTLPILPEHERRMLLEEFNFTEAPAKSLPQFVHQCVDEHARQRPEAPALCWGDRQWSYATLNAGANRLANHLVGLGLRPDQRVGLLMERGAEVVLAILAVFKAGGAYVPLDPTHPLDRLQYILDDSSPAVLISSHGLHQRLGISIADIPVVELDGMDGDGAPWSSAGLDAPDPQALGLTPQHLAYVIYTSGSTGQPKGVMLPHEALRHYTQGAVALFGLQPDDRVMQQNSINFDLSVEEIMPALAAGAALHIQREVLHAAGDPCTASVVHLTAAHWHRLVAQKDHDVQRLLASVRLINVTGDALSAQMLQRWLQIKPARTRLVNTYGPTETAVSCTAAYLGEPAPHGVVTIGRPLQGARIYILDARGEPVPVGVPGELYIGGAGVARGYLNRPELTAERFLANPFAAKPGARMYKTGDLGRWLPDGTIEFLGRNDFQVKVRGFRIELGEIEARLLEHPDVRQAVVLAREDQPGDRRLVAYYVGEEDVGAEALRAHLAKALPDYTVPAAYVHLEHLPLTPNGKLDRKVLPAPDRASLSVGEYMALKTETEGRLVEIWAQLLHIPAGNIGIHDNFFALGGHSLMVTRLVAQIRSLFQVELAILTVFENSDRGGAGVADRREPAELRKSAPSWGEPAAKARNAAAVLRPAALVVP